MEMLGEDARRILHRHLVAGERHHPGAELEVQSVERRPLERRRRQRQGSPGAPPTERTRERPTLPPLSWTLRDSPSATGEPWPRLTPSVSGGASTPAAAFQSALPPAVLLPESFRGGCSFGAAPDIARPLLRACIQRHPCSTLLPRAPSCFVSPTPSSFRNGPQEAVSRRYRRQLGRDGMRIDEVSARPRRNSEDFRLRQFDASAR